MAYCSSMYQPLKRVIVKHPNEAFLNQEHLANEWKTFNYLEEPNFKRRCVNMKDFIAYLKNMCHKSIIYQHRLK